MQVALQTLSSHRSADLLLRWEEHFGIQSFKKDFKFLEGRCSLIQFALLLGVWSLKNPLNRVGIEPRKKDRTY